MSLNKLSKTLYSVPSGSQLAATTAAMQLKHRVFVLTNNPDLGAFTTPKRVPKNQLWLYQVIDTLQVAVNCHNHLLQALLRENPEVLEQSLGQFDLKA